MVKAAVMGYGTIGSGVVEVIEKNAALLKEKAGQAIEVKYVLDLREFPGDPVEKILVHDVNVILEDPEVSIVVETMGGTKPAYQFVKAALEKGKSVCTSNKELVAKHGTELMALAKEKNINFLFEASVGGGIPIIRPLNSCLTSDEVDEVAGILNGTTNYILTRMDREGADFAEVLKDAQKLGYAEKNPSADVDGFDACRKIAILSSLAYGHQVDFEDIYTEGITKITAQDFLYAHALGRSIKLFGMSRHVGENYYAMVSPVMVGSEHPLYAVNDVFNGIMVEGDCYGRFMFYGKGAGKLATATAVVSDVVEAAKNPDRTVMNCWSGEKLQLSDLSTAVRKFFVRLSDPEGKAKEAAAAAFGEVTPVQAEGVTGEYAFVTPEMSESEFAAKAETCPGFITRIRLED